MSDAEIQGSDSEAFFQKAGCPPNRLQKLLISLARSTPLHRGKMRHRMTQLIMSLGSNRPIDAVFRGCTYRIEGRNNLVEYGLLLNPRFNIRDIDFLLEGLPTGGTAVDIGSNIGLYSLPLAKKAGPSGKVISIDANPSMAGRLMWNAEASGLANISMHACAVGSHDGKVDLKIRKNDIAIVAVEESETGSIPMRSLKSILDEQGLAKIDVLKIDIEGYEDKALAPFLNEADETMRPRRIVIEYSENDDYPECKVAFDRFGYRLISRSKNNSFYQKEEGRA